MALARPKTKTNLGKSRKIPENSGKFRKIPENPGHAREYTSKLPEPPSDLGKQESRKMQLINCEIPEDPGRSRKILETRIQENPGNL
jgi:hypothetical protein